MKRAFISVTDKTGIVDFAKELIQLDFEIISTGGTMAQLVEAGIACKSIDEVTKFPEMLDGRVKTLHPMIHGGLLYRRDLASHVETVKEHGIEAIDLVCVNLYEFEKALKAGKPMADMIENIDIGGPSMIRSAAKNFKDVLIVTDPSDYSKVVEALKEETVDYDFRLNLAYKAFSTTGSYDAMISRYFAGVVGDTYPDTLNLTLKKTESLRYGENSHQNASSYVDPFVQHTLLDYEQLHGKEISFNNVNDLYGAVALVREFDGQVVTAAIKHSTPCGVAIDKTGYDSYMKAYNADPQSIFGGIVAVNYEIDEATALEMNKTFLEIVAAPSFSEAGLEVLKRKKNLRILKLKDLSVREAKYDIKYLEGKVLVQDINDQMIKEMKVVTTATPTSEQISDMLVYLGAGSSNLILETVMVDRAMRNTITRQTNCINANIDRQVESNSRHMDAIMMLSQRNMLDSLPNQLREVALARMQYQEVSLAELADLCNMSKSGIRHRLNKLVQLAEDIRQ